MRKVRHLFFAAFAASVVAVPALAQQAGSSGYPAPCPASQVSKSDVDRAHTVFLSGKGFLDESNYDKAISYFKDAYSIDCSVHAILPIIATAYERKGDKQSAVGALQEYLKRVPNAPDREVVERRIKNLQDQIAQEKAAAATAAPTASTPPTATTAAPSATTTTAPTATTTATVEPTSTATAAPTTEGGGHSVAPWIVVGVGGAAVVAGVVLFAVGAGDISTAEKTCPVHNNCNDPNAQSTGNTGRTLETVGVVAGSVGVAAVVGGLLWHFLETPGAPSTTGATVTPVVAPGYAGLGLGGRF
jgi:tetratricopeptide (TPR) repeat protein